MFRSLLLVLSAVGSASASNPVPQSLVVSPADQDRARALVAQLGDPRFAMRETAQKELAEMGRKALLHLATGAADSPDPEVRLRCRKLIPAARTLDFQARVDAFLADADGKYKHDLPGLEVFFGATGKNETARKIYLDILKSEENRKLLAESEGDKAALATTVSNRAYELYTRQYPRSVVVNGQVVQSTAMAKPTPLDVLALLIVDTRATGERVAARRSITYSPAYSMQIVQEFRTEAMANTPTGDVCRKIVGQWLDTRTDAQDLYYGMNFLSNSNQKEETIRAAKKLLEIKGGASSYRGMALTTLSRMGGNETVGLILPYLTDDSLCIKTSTGNGGVVDIQIRDVALAVVVSSTGQKLADYGFQSRNTNQVVSYSTQWFDSEDDRKKGFVKWAEWAKANPKVLEVKSQKK